MVLSRNGTWCKASSSYTGYSCKGAIDGKYGTGGGAEWASNGEGVGAAIQLTFPEEYRIVRMKIVTRDSLTKDRAEDVVVLFSDTSEYDVCYNLL